MNNIGFVSGLLLGFSAGSFCMMAVVLILLTKRQKAENEARQKMYHFWDHVMDYQDRHISILLERDK